MGNLKRLRFFFVSAQFLYLLDCLSTYVIVSHLNGVELNLLVRMFGIVPVTLYKMLATCVVAYIAWRENALWLLQILVSVFCVVVAWNCINIILTVVGAV